MRSIFVSIALLCFFTTQSFAEETTSKPEAEYAFLLGGSAFGPSGSFVYNSSKKTSWAFSLGGTPDLDIELEIEDESYEVTSESSWLGVFVNHRPFEKASWLRLVAGLGVGRIDNFIQRKSGGFLEDQYEAVYKESPFGYLGLGFGMKPVKGFIWGVDIGWLQTSGPEVRGLTNDATEGRIDAIKHSFWFGSALPNVQFSVGYGF